MAARSIASLSLSFGLVSIPVKLYSATESAGTVRFNMLSKDGSRLKQQYISEKDQTVVERSEMVKGYEFEKDRFVIFEPEELKALQESPSHTIDIVAFIPTSAIDPIFYDKTYFLAPDKRGRPSMLITCVRGNVGPACALVNEPSRWAGQCSFQPAPLARWTVCSSHSPGVGFALGQTQSGFFKSKGDTMKYPRGLLIALFTSYGSLNTDLRAQAPALINYQGRVVNGTNLVNGNVGLALRLYNQASGGTLLYEDSNTVTVADGLYSTFLGDNTTTGTLAAALANTNVFLEVRVNGSALAPRERVGAAAYAAHAWGLSGNAGTTPGTHFLGTTDNQPLELRANNAAALRLLPSTGFWEAPHVLGGHIENSITANDGAVIAGGGATGFPNVVIRGLGHDQWRQRQQRFPAMPVCWRAAKRNSLSATFAVVGGGGANRVESDYGTDRRRPVQLHRDRIEQRHDLRRYDEHDRGGCGIRHHSGRRAQLHRAGGGLCRDRRRPQQPGRRHRIHRAGRIRLPGR